jgi:hypothetical protein
MRKSSGKRERPGALTGAQATSPSQKASPGISQAGPIKKRAAKSRSGPAKGGLVQLSVRVTPSFRQAARRVSLEEDVPLQDLVIRGLHLLGVPVETAAGAVGADVTPGEQRRSERVDPAAGSSPPGTPENAAVADLILALLGAAHALLRRESLPQKGKRGGCGKVLAC